jgi:ATP-binding cassette subfamily B protein
MALPEPKKNVRIWPVLKAYGAVSLRYPGTLVAIFLSTIALQAAALLAPLYLKSFINIISSGTPSALVTHSLLVLLAAYALIGAGSWASRRVNMIGIMYIEAEAMADLENDAFANLMGHGHDFFISNFAGTLGRKVTRYSRAYEQVLDSIVFNFLSTFLFAIGSIFVLSQRSLWLGMALLLWVVIFIVVQIVMTKWHQGLRAKRVAEDSRMTGALSDAISNHSAVTLFAAEKYEIGTFGSIVNAWRDATSRSWKANAWMQGIQGALAITVEVGLLVIAVFLWNKGLITVGDFVLIQVYILGLIDQIWNIGNTFRRLYDAFADASEMIDIFDTPHEIQDAPSAKTVEIAKGEIIFDDVSFYFTEAKPVLDRFSLDITGGEKVALVGSSGAGKSTLTKLLLRLYDLKAGTITIDGQDISKITQESLRSNISFVPQEPILFHRTLGENIRYGRLDATEAEVIEAAKQAHCHEFIAALPQGYDTMVGERGVKLSGGERQRIVIARAILKNAPILVLDEATSSLDSESEALIQDALAKLMEGKTVIAIAHRLSTIMKMDRIIVMEKGKVVLTGTHDELIAQGSNLYKKLWEIQAGGFISPKD